MPTKKRKLQVSAKRVDIPHSDTHIKLKQQALEQGLRFHAQLEAVIGCHESYEPDSMSDRELHGEVIFARWEDKGLL